MHLLYFGFNDLSAPDPYYILPVLMGATMFIQTWLNPTPPDPMQARLMKIMPIAFSVFFFFFPAGLGALLAREQHPVHRSAVADHAQPRAVEAPLMARADIIAAVATAAGRSAIGSGPTVWGAPSASIEAATGTDAGTPPGDAHRLPRRWRDRDRHGLALYFPAPHSYTGEDVLELQGHGGPAVRECSVLRRCLELGARLAEPGEFTRRAFLNGQARPGAGRERCRSDRSELGGGGALCAAVPEG